MKSIGRSGLNPGQGGLHAGYLTFHRIDAKLVKSPSVVFPMRTVGYALALAVVALIGLGSLGILQSDAGLERAIVLFQQGTEALAIQSNGLDGS